MSRIGGQIEKGKEEKKEKSIDDMEYLYRLFNRYPFGLMPIEKYNSIKNRITIQCRIHEITITRDEYDGIVEMKFVWFDPQMMKCTCSEDDCLKYHGTEVSLMETKKIICPLYPRCPQKNKCPLLHELEPPIIKDVSRGVCTGVKSIPTHFEKEEIFVDLVKNIYSQCLASARRYFPKIGDSCLALQQSCEGFSSDHYINSLFVSVRILAESTRRKMNLSKKQNKTIGNILKVCNPHAHNAKKRSKDREKAFNEIIKYLFEILYDIFMLEYKNSLINKKHRS